MTKLPTLVLLLALAAQASACGTVYTRRGLMEVRKAAPLSHFYRLGTPATALGEGEGDPPDGDGPRGPPPREGLMHTRTTAVKNCCNRDA